MRQTSDAITQNLAARRCWEVARRDEPGWPAAWSRQPRVDGGYRLDEGALLDGFCHFLQASGVMGLLAQVDGAAVQREMVLFVPYVLLDGVKTLCGIERMHAWPASLFSAKARMRLVGFNAHQVRDRVCQRGVAKRQHARAPPPIGPDTLANNLVQGTVRALEALFNGVLRALAKAGGFGKRVVGGAEGTDVETTERSADCGQVPRKVHIQDKRGHMHAIEGAV